MVVAACGIVEPAFRAFGLRDRFAAVGSLWFSQLVDI